MTTKRCYECEIEKPVESFGLNKNKHDSLNHRCRACCNTRGLKRFRRKNYGINDWDVNELLKAQDFKCPICDIILTKQEACIDHCHKTSKIRGALCRRCNSALGMLKDSIERVQKALDYLKKG
jgi:uncharacterized C2H2 Zn-finger protein